MKLGLATVIEPTIWLYLLDINPFAHYMAKQQKQSGARRYAVPTEPSPFEQARDELFQHIMRCGVVGAAPEHVDEWFAETIKYMTERFPELSEQQIEELKTLGLRFAQPPKSRNESNAASAA